MSGICYSGTMLEAVRSSRKDFLFVSLVFLLCLQWVILKNLGIHLGHPWSVLAPGLAIFGAAFMLSWGAELAQFEIPQSLAIAFLALIAVLPEYAVDMYFAWEAGKDPQYIHYATANMTGANRLLIGVGWAAVVFAYFFKTKKGEVQLEPVNRLELFALSVATLYSFIIPFRGSLSWVDSIFLLMIFAWYMFQTTRAHHEEPEVEGPIASIGGWPRGRRLVATFFFFLFSGYTIWIAAEPFAEGLLSAGRLWGIEEFILVQWLAPLASESPEFIIAIIFALRARATASIGTLISSKVNQWTLLIGMLPLVYNLSAGHWNPMVMDARQSEEIFLTAAQSLFAIVIIANLRFSITEALLLFVLFITQLFFTSTEARNIYAVVYIVLAIGWALVVKGNRQGFLQIARDGLRNPKNFR
ncbi:MAG: sodium:calcium antiporter [Deltaproteobacteria bacterium]|nr:sodium:calcium antiporter [Deltaproteobacteria bacterium]